MIENDEQIPILVSIIPKLIRGGHIIPYHIAVSKAANYIRWKHITVVPANESVVSFPGECYAALSSLDMEEKIHYLARLVRFSDVWKLAITIADFLKNQVLPHTNSPILFLENFIHTQLLALLIALCIIPKKNKIKINVWLLYRQETHKAKTGWIYKLINQLIKKIVSPGKFHLLTDSDVLCKSLGDYFNEVITVMPIPHTDLINFDDSTQKNDDIICWWPGAPRAEKGWDIIKSLANINYEVAKEVCLIASESSELSSLPNGIKLQLIDNFLPKTEYLNFLQKSDIVLLPYDSIAYGERTSGIFTECIVAGKIPLVTPGTWMAKELTKYNIEELIIDWDQPNLVINEIINIHKSSTIRRKIKKIQEEYQKFHSIEGYARQMKNLLEGSSKL